MNSAPLGGHEIGENDVGGLVLDPFGFWFAGLVDGEGHFGITRAGSGWRCCFVLQLRDDDRPILEEVCRRLEVGTVRAINRQNDDKWNPLARLDVQTKGDCLRLVDFFDTYPLRSKKRRDYLTWRRAVEEWQLIQSRESSDWSVIEAAFHELREGRAYVAPEGIA